LKREPAGTAAFTTRSSMATRTRWRPRPRRFLRHHLLQRRHLRQKFKRQGFEVGERQIVKVVRRRHAATESQDEIFGKFEMIGELFGFFGSILCKIYMRRKAVP
jgi:hypothetical protein